MEGNCDSWWAVGGIFGVKKLAKKFGSVLAVLGRFFATYLKNFLGGNERHRGCPGVVFLHAI